jgi:hypothetical protein
MGCDNTAAERIIKHRQHGINKRVNHIFQNIAEYKERWEHSHEEVPPYLLTLSETMDVLNCNNFFMDNSNFHKEKKLLFMGVTVILARA